jgi:hypothetical protein
MLKTMEGWRESRLMLDHYLQIDDEVDEDIVNYFINVLPPITWNGECIQIGEAIDVKYDKRIKKCRNTYSTLKSNKQFTPNRKWYYAGDCFKGETTEPRKEE